MNLRGFRAFTTELLKIAAEIQDADVRALQADRVGEEYLQGGKLPSNDPRETNFVPKIAFSQMGNGIMDLKAQKKNPGVYQHVRDWGWRGLQGATVGAGVTQMGHNLLGRTGTASTKALRSGALIGTGAALADKAWRHRNDNAKTAMFNSSTFSPARQMQQGSNTGKFANTIHDKIGGKPAGLIGKEFRLPPIGE